MRARQNQITATMAAALAMAHAHGGRLVRHAGGFWSYQDCPRLSHNGLAAEHFGDGTINGLVSRRRMRFSAWRKRSRNHGEFPIAAELVPSAAGRRP